MLPPFDDSVPPAERTAELPWITDAAATVPAHPPAPPLAPPLAPPVSTGWTARLPAAPPPAAAGPQPMQAPVPAPASAPAPAPAQGSAPTGLGGGLRGRILVVEGGYGSAGRRPWGRTGSAGQAPVLSAMLASVSPQILLAADAVDAVHLPGASDPQSVLAHLRAASRHVGPLLVHIGGHLVADRRGGHLYLTLRDSKGAGTVRQDGLAWQAIADELRHRSPEWDTLVIADLSAEQAAWPQVQSSISPLMDGVPLWAVVSPDPEQIGTFTRALIEALHIGRPGAEAVLAPEHLRQQVHSVLRPDTIILSSYPADRPVFRNTARRLGDSAPDPEASVGPRPSAVMPKPPARSARSRPAAGRVVLSKPEPDVTPVSSRGPVTLLKAGVPPTPPRPARPVSLLKRTPETAGAVAALISLSKPDAAAPKVALTKPEPSAVPEAAPVQVPDPFGTERAEVVSLSKPGAATPAADPSAAEPDYREMIGRIVQSADAGEHETAARLARELEELTTTAHGPVAAPVLQARQVRAHVSRLAGQPVVAAEIYREVALTLLRAQGPDHPETQRAATNAEACWRAVTDRAEAIRIAPEIIELRAYLPGPEGRKLRSSERYLKQLVEAQAELAEQAEKPG